MKQFCFKETIHQFIKDIDLQMHSPADLKNLADVRRHWCEVFTNEHGRITAWTFVPKNIVEDVLSGSIKSCRMEFSEDADEFRLAYEWMKDAMDESGIKGRSPGINPWWCWIRVGGGQVKPTDLNADEGSVLLELSLHPDDVLLSDFHMWHVPLNYWFNAEDGEEDAFENELAAAGLNIYRQKPLPEPFHSRVLASWRDVFYLDRLNGYTCEYEEKGIQGVFWTINPENIVGVVEPDIFVDQDEPESISK